MTAGEKDRLFKAAQGEQNPELRAEAVAQLGNMNAHEELWQLYQKETSIDVKRRIVRSMQAGGSIDRLIELAKAEQNADLRRDAVRALGMMRSTRTGDVLVQIYSADTNVDVRKSVINALFIQENATALVALARKEQDVTMKKELVGRLSQHAQQDRHRLHDRAVEQVGSRRCRGHSSTIAATLTTAAALGGGGPRAAAADRQRPRRRAGRRGAAGRLSHRRRRLGRRRLDRLRGAGRRRRAGRCAASTPARTFVNGSVVMSDGAACCGTCGLEPSLGGTSMSTRPQSPQPGGPIKLEGADEMVVLFRVVNRQVERVRVFSEDCQLDAGGRDVTWFTAVTPAESIALLESLVDRPDGTPRSDHRRRDQRDRAPRGAAADAALERLLAPTQPQAVRAKVPFWLGQHARPPRARGPAAGDQGRSVAGREEEGGLRHLAEP